MTDFDPGGLAAIPRRTAEAAEAMEALREPARRAADSIDEAFSRAGASLSRSLARAAADGEVSLAELAQAVLAAVNAAAGQGAGGGLGDILSTVLKGGFAGARASGGPVLPGGSYLVGERGPEVFRPAGAGVVESAGGGVTVNVTVQGAASPERLIRSEAQIAQAMARAVSLGARRL